MRLRERRDSSRPKIIVVEFPVLAFISSGWDCIVLSLKETGRLNSRFN
jgi:hypothetical protein